MLKRVLSLGLITATILLAACGGGGTSPTGAGGSGASGGAGGAGGMGGAGGAGGMGGAGGGGGEGGAMEVDPLAGVGAVEKVTTMDHLFTEGPQWNPATKTLLFTDIPANRIYEHTPGGGIEVFRDPSGNANGLAIDPDGLLIAAEHSGRRVSRTLGDGTVVAIVDSYEGKKLNSPNDVIVRKDGNLYFTDPPYGLSNPADSELGFFGVFRVTPAGEIQLIADDMVRPNGIVLSPDESTLYVNDTSNGDLRAYSLGKEGDVGTMSKLATTAPNPDGMAVDDAGNLYVTTAEGVEVWSPQGKRWGKIDVPEQPSNCAFGGEDRKTLYITARKSVYRVALQVTGMY